MKWRRWRVRRKNIGKKKVRRNHIVRKKGKNGKNGKNR